MRFCRSLTSPAISFVSALVVAMLSAPIARANTIATYSLDAIYYFMPGTITGSFTVDLTTNTILDVDIIGTSTDSHWQATFTAPSQSGQDGYIPGTHSYLYFRTSGANSGGYADLLEIYLKNPLSITSTVFPFDPNVSPFGMVTYCGDFASYCGSSPLDINNSEIALTPIPATLPLFLSGIAGVGGLLRWRKKKTAQAVAL